MSTNDVSILIPVYNAEKWIVPAAESLLKEFQSHPAVFEILFCDDGSSDGSLDILLALARQNSCVKVLRNKENQGLGAAIRKLIRHAEADIVIYCDADLPFTARGVFRIYEEMQNADIVVGSRYAGEENHVPFLRKIFSRLYWCLSRILFNVIVRDIGSGTVAFKRQKVQSLMLESNGFDIHLELFAKAVRSGLVVKEIGLCSQKNNQGSFSIFKHGLQSFFDLIRWHRRLAAENSKNPNCQRGAG
ncbi:MAG: glycosyltransferase family 2 protein [Candidatus Omnitrophota bacterium]